MSITKSHLLQSYGGNVAFPYQEMEGKIDIALKLDFGPVMVMDEK
jgi:hypothetical protein